MSETLYRFTAADAEAIAGRSLTQEERALVGDAIGNSSIPEAFAEVVFACTGSIERGTG